VSVDPTVAQTQNGDHEQNNPEQMMKSTNIPSLGKQEGSLIEFHDDMKKSLPVVDAPPLAREDTDTHSIDEFHDARG
jgi:hypothetical protein